MGSFQSWPPKVEWADEPPARIDAPPPEQPTKKKKKPKKQSKPRVRGTRR